VRARTRVLRLLRKPPEHPVSEILTATEIAARLQLPLASVSGLLKRMVDERTLKRASGWGARGGYGYYR
jgi:DNA-binding IclR family transcriptional regulator